MARLKYLIFFFLFYVVSLNAFEFNGYLRNTSYLSQESKSRYYFTNLSLLSMDFDAVYDDKGEVYGNFSFMVIAPFMLGITEAIFGPDIDRLYIKMYSGNGSLTVGKQSLHWGSAQVFRLQDYFSPVPLMMSSVEEVGVNSFIVSGSYKILSFDGIVAANDFIHFSRGVNISLEWNRVNIGVNYALLNRKQDIFGLNFTFSLNNFIIYDEFVIIPADDNALQNTIGVSFASGSLMTNFEYFYNDIQKDYHRFMPTKFYIYPYFWYSNKNYIAVTGSYGIEEIADIQLLSMINIDDKSNLSFLSVSKMVVQDLNVGFGISFIDGHQNTEFYAMKKATGAFLEFKTWW